jgi:hypothetical protein
MKYFHAFILIIAVFLSYLTSFSQQTFYVTSPGDSGEGSLRDILILVNDGDTVRFNDDIDTIYMTTGEFIIGKSVNIIGKQAKTILKRANDTADFRIINIHSDNFLEVHLANLLITGGKAPDGTEESTTGQYGGGIFIGQDYHQVYLESCQVIGNLAGNGYGGYSSAGNGGDGGGIYSNCYVSLVNCEILNNGTGTGLPYVLTNDNLEGTNGGNGGGLYTNNDIDIASCSFIGNYASPGAGVSGLGHYTPHTTAGNGGFGGGLLCMNGAAHIFDCYFSGNASGEGGYASCQYGATAGDAGHGGGAYFNASDVVIENSQFYANVTGDGGSASGGSGGYGNSCGSGGDGGAVYLSNGNIRILNSEMTGNACGGAGSYGEYCAVGANGGSGGGAFIKEGDTVIISGTLFDHNSTGNGGYCFGDGSGHYNNNNGGNGGGLMICYVSNYLKISNSQFLGNATGNGGSKYSWEYNSGWNGGNGGGICLQDNTAPAYIVNSLIAGNSTGKSYLFDNIDYDFDNRPKAGEGGGIFEQNSPVYLVNVTCAGNKTGLSVLEGIPISITDTLLDKVMGKGGGFYLPGDNNHMINTIISDNTIADTLIINDIAGLTQADYSLIKDTTLCVITGEQNIFTIDPSFRHFPDSLMLTVTSIAINAGNPDTSQLYLPPNDLAGNPRIFNNIIDIGAYELQELPYRIDETEPLKATVFPVPANQELYVRFNLEQAENVMIHLTDLAGNTLNSQNARIIKGGNLYRIRTDALPAGIYFMRFQSDEQVFVAKVLIMHK